MSNERLETEVEYLKNTIACLKGENAALKEELAQQTYNSAMVPCSKVADILDWYGPASSKLVRISALLAQHQ